MFRTVRRACPADGVSAPKVVFSKTLQTAGWAGSRIVRGHLAGEIASLKREPGQDIMAHGGATFVPALSRLGLIDADRPQPVPGELRPSTTAGPTRRP